MARDPYAKMDVGPVVRGRVPDLDRAATVYDRHAAAFASAPGERIGAPLPPRRRRRILPGLVLLGALGAGAVHYRDPSILPEAWSTVATVSVPWLAQAVEQARQVSQRLTATTPVPAPTGVPATPAPTTAEDVAAGAQPAGLPPLPARSSSAGLDPGPAATGSLPTTRADTTVTIVAVPPVTAVAAVPYAPPPKAVDRYQVKAEGAGLHPGLSATLLAQLSDADFRNAGVAIETALAEVADDAVHVWPRQRKGDLALFKVHFVSGAAPDCRRYVVTIAKAGWLTTALPMERCGVRRKGS